MGFFSKSPFQLEVDAATDGQQEDWNKIMDICDKARINSQNAKDCLSSILTRLKNPDHHIVLQAITLLDACVNNAGKNFHLEVASRDFENEYRKILTKAKGEVKTKLLEVLKKWAEGEFSKDDQLSLIPHLVMKLRMEGLQFPDSQKPKNDKAVTKMLSEKEQNDMKLAIELSLKESTSLKSKTASSSGSVYPTASLSGGSVVPASFSQEPTERRKVRALYDFEGEEGELTFSAGEIITILDSEDASWWKGENKRGVGLLPSNFVTSDLTVESEVPNKRSVQFADQVRVKKIVKEEVEIDERKMDKLLQYLHEADPADPSKDPPDMNDLVDEVNAMGSLIDGELSKVDSKHAELTQLCMDVQGAINLYHSLVPETAHPPEPTYLGKPISFPYGPQQVNGGPGMMSGHFVGIPPHVGQPGPSHGVPGGMPPPHFIPDPSIRNPNGMPPHYGPPGVQPPPPGTYPMPPLGAPVHAQPGYHDKPPLH